MKLGDVVLPPIGLLDCCYMDCEEDTPGIVSIEIYEQEAICGKVTLFINV